MQWSLMVKITAIWVEDGSDSPTPEEDKLKILSAIASWFMSSMLVKMLSF